MRYPLISILMSVYNETEKYIKESVSSILNQTFSNFELIVIDDNPKRDDVKKILESFNDNRIVFHKNPTNIGLALSMNKAAEIARADIYARMDSDDIAMPNRLQEEYNIISDNNIDCDFVFSGYETMDDDGNYIDTYINKSYASLGNLNSLIMWKMSVIHHPTVMFKKHIFNKTNGYRNFPCSQDADLWFRMAEAGCKFSYIPQVLLRYRKNSQSVSNQKWFLQKITGYYIFSLAIERSRKGSDSFSPEQYQKYLIQWGVNDSAKENELRNSYKMLQGSFKYNRIESIIRRVYVFLSSKLLRHYYIQLLERKIRIKNIHQ